MRFALATILSLALSACVTTYYRDTQSGLTVRSSEKARGGERGQLHPAIIEFVMASEDAPYRAVFASTYVEPTEGGTASARSGEEGARAMARLLAEPINKGLAHPEHRPGVVEIFSRGFVDRDTGRLEDKAMLFSLLMVNRSAKVVRLEWSDARTNRALTWDLSRLPDTAYSATGELSYEQVRQAIRPLHRPQRRHY